MDIYLSSLPLQIISIFLILTFSWVSYKNPRFSAWLIPLLLPLYLIKIYLPFPVRAYSNMTLPTNLLEILIIIFLVINYRLIIKAENRLLKSNIGYLILFTVSSLIIISLFSSFTGANLLPALGATKSWFILPIFFFLALSSLFSHKATTTDKDCINTQYGRINEQYGRIAIRPIYQIYYLVSFILGGLFLSIASLFFIWNKIYTYDGRLAGLFLSPNQLAMSLVPSLLALSVFFFYRREISDVLQNFYSKFIRSLSPIFQFLDMSHNIFSSLLSGLFILFFLAEIAILYLTFSYGTWLGLLGAFVFLCIIRRSHLLNCHAEPACPGPYGSGVSASSTFTFSSSSPQACPRAEAGMRGGGLLRPEGLKGSILEYKAGLKFIIISIITLSLLLLSQLSNPKLQHILNGDYYSSLHSRLMIWQSALKITTDYPIFGIGPGNFQQVYLDYASHFSEPYIEWAVPQPHNIFLAFSTQLGLLGLAFFILLLCLIGYILYNKIIYRLSLKKRRVLDPPLQKMPIQKIQQIRKSSLHNVISFSFFSPPLMRGSGLPRPRGLKYPPLQILAFAYFIYFIGHGLIDTPYFKNDLSLIFWIMLAGIL